MSTKMSNMSKGISKNVVKEGCEKNLLERLINFIPFTEFDTIRNQIFHVLK